MAVFITGASSGIGRAFAQHYAQAGHTLGLVARRSERLNELCAQIPGHHHAYSLDVTDRAALQQAAHDFQQAVGEVDTVIACAGMSAGTLTQCQEDFAVFEHLFAVNVFSTMATFEPFIESMRRAGTGTLVGISSVAGVRGLPGAGAYSASKAAVTTYCESLRVELAPQGISVVTLAPGYVVSEMTAQNPYRMPFLLPAETFVRRAARAIDAKRRYTVIPWQMGVISRLMRILPNALYDRLAVNAPRKPRQKV